jgi:hypothetical protein
VDITAEDPGDEIEVFLLGHADQASGEVPMFR